jgi:hypothetical protein
MIHKNLVFTVFLLTGCGEVTAAAEGTGEAGAGGTSMSAGAAGAGGSGGSAAGGASGGAGSTGTGMAGGSGTGGAACHPGIIDCPCWPDGTCNGDFRCTSESICAYSTGGTTGAAGRGGTTGAAGRGGSSGSAGATGTGGSTGAGGRGGSGAGGTAQQACVPACVEGQTCTAGSCYGYAVCTGKVIECFAFVGTSIIPCPTGKTCTVQDDGTGRMTDGTRCSCSTNSVICSPGTSCN